MSNVLLTGMTAGHGSPKANGRTATFASQLHRALVAAGHTVTWTYPDMDWDDRYFDAYDSIIIGVAPVLSVTANHAYGALKAVDTLFFDPRLTLFIDAPVPAQITASLSAALAEPTRLIKSFFNSRPGYAQATGTNRIQIFSAVQALCYGDWPTTIYPKLPWADSRPDWFDWMPLGFIDSAVGVNLDALGDPIVDPNPEVTDALTAHLWMSENMNSAWLNRVLKNLTFNVIPMKEWRAAPDSYVQYIMMGVVGSIIPPAKDGQTWWTPRIMHSLTVGTPVITEWRHSHSLAPEWGVLGGTIEDMKRDQRVDLATKQFDAYIGAIQNSDQATTQLLQLLKL